MIRADDIIATETQRPGPAAIERFVAAVRSQYGDAVDAILFYGSCRRQDQADGLYDLYVIVDAYRTLPWFEALLARLLPPNVYYLEVGAEEALRRSKCTLIDADDFRRGTSRHWFHSYLWARFAQPVTLAYARDETTATEVRHCLANATTTFLNRVAPLQPNAATVDTQTLWTTGLRACYRAELRNEGPDRAVELYDASRDYYEALTRALAGTVPGLTATDEGWHIAFSRSGRRASLLGWRARVVLGKLLSVARVLKAWITFDGGLDYLIWKLERHAGRPIEVPDRVRRAPLIFVWGFLWRLYREGVFR